MICVTGGSGFFGIALVKKLLSLGHRVRVLDREDIDAALEPSVEFVRVDIRDREGVIKALEGCTVVYHNAAVVPVSRAGEDFWSINERGTENVLEGAYRADAARVIHYSTSQSLFGINPGLPVTEETPQHPFGDYGRSKHAAEKICLAYRDKGLNISIVRPRTIVGAGRLGIFQILFERIRQGRLIPLPGGGYNRLQLVGLEDLIAVSLLLLEKGHGQDFNIGAEHFGMLREDIGALLRHTATGARILNVPVWLSVPTGWMLEKLGLSPFVDLHYRTIHKDFYFDAAKAKQALGWESHESNKDALIKGYDWYVDNVAHIAVDSGSTHRRGVRQKFLRWLP